MHFQLTKYNIFLRKEVLPPCNLRQGASPLDPHIISRCLDVLNSGFHDYQFYNVHWGLCDFDASWDWKNNVSHNAPILPSFFFFYLIMP